jgi:hypothetical protein
MTVQSAAPTSISVDGTSDENTKTPRAELSPSATPQPSGDEEMRLIKTKEVRTTLARTALAEAITTPTRFADWTDPVRGLSLATQKLRTTPDGLTVVLLAIKNRSSETLTLLDDTPDVFIEIVDRGNNPVAIRAVENLHIEMSNMSRTISPGETIYVALAFTSPVLSVNEVLRANVMQTNASDQPATIILGQNQDRSSR